MTWRSIWSVWVKVWMFRSHQSVHSQSETLKVNCWSTVHLISDLMMEIGLRGLIHVHIVFIYHVKHHHGRIWSQIKISQNGNWTCNWNLPKMESLDPQNYILIQASNEFLPNMKVEDLVLPFPKSPRTLNSHVWLASYDRIDFRNSWTSKGHISQTI